MKRGPKADEVLGLISDYPLCVEEALSVRVKRLAEEDSALIVWWGTPIECYSALARRRREKMITSTDEELAQYALALLLEVWTEIEASREVREAASASLRL